MFAENRELNFELLRLEEHTKNFTRKLEQKLDDAKHKIEMTKLQQDKINKQSK